MNYPKEIDVRISPNRHITLAALPLCTFLSACALPELSAEQAAAMSNNQLCQAYSHAEKYGHPNRLSSALRELKKRGAISDRDYKDIRAHRIRTGMKEHIAICSWGPYEDINSTTMRGYQSRQIVIDLGTYIYTENGRVYAWQD
jgi:hypothetical protein